MTLIILSLLTSFNLYAQSSDVQSSQSVSEPTTPPAPVAGETQTLEKVVVTGSYIKRVAEEGPAVVQTFNKEDLQKSGQNSVADVLRNSAVMSGVGRETSMTANGGVSTAAIRGFSSSDILVLLNGQRLPKVGGGNTVDLNLIPITALERVEILKDGASALYGSDAVGGVINFITKKDYDGGSVMARYSHPEEEGGQRLDLAGSFGKTWKDSSIMGVVQYRNNKGLFDRDRYFSKIDDVKTQGSPFGSPGTWRQGSTFNAGSTADPCPPERIGPRGQCMFDTSVYSMNLPDIEQVSTLISGHTKVANNLKFSMSGIYSRREVNSQLAPGLTPNLPLTQAQANSIGLPATGDVVVSYRTVEELGPRKSLAVTDSYIAQPALELRVGTWDLELATSYGLTKTNSTNQNGYANQNTLIGLLGPGAGQWNPFAAPGSKGNLASAAYKPWQSIENSHATARLIAQGPLHQGSDSLGPIAMAAGVSADRQAFRQISDSLSSAGEVFGGGTGANGEGDRTFQSVFAEFSYFPVDTVETSLAMRFDRFSDFGETFNPKLSASWNVTDTFLIKSSVGTGFRAPDLDSLYQSLNKGAPFFIDRLACNDGVPGTCRPSQYQVEAGGNPNLKEETSIFYNLGFATQPKRNWNITFDGFYALIRNRVGLDLTDLTRVEEQIGRQGILDKYGIQIDRDPSGGIVEILNARDQNTASYRVGGLDFTITHEADIKPFGKPLKLQTSFEHQHVLFAKSRSFDLLPFEKNRDLNWRNVVSLGVKTNRQRYLLIARTFPASDKALNEGQLGLVGYGSTYMYTEFDIDYTLMKVWKGDITAGVRNILNTKRPLDSTAPASQRLNTTLFDPIGRSVYLGYTYNF